MMHSSIERLNRQEGFVGGVVGIVIGVILGVLLVVFGIIKFLIPGD